MKKESSESCACTQKMIDLLRAGSSKKSSLKKIVCAGCGKVFWANFDRKYCFDCEQKASETS